MPRFVTCEQRQLHRIAPARCRASARVAMPACSCSNVEMPAPCRTTYGVACRIGAGVALHSSPRVLVAQVEHVAHRVAHRIVVPGREAIEVAVLRPGEAAAALRDDEAAARVGDDVRPRRGRQRRRRAGGSRSRPSSVSPPIPLSSRSGGAERRVQLRPSAARRASTRPVRARRRRRPAACPCRAVAP